MNLLPSRTKSLAGRRSVRLPSSSLSSDSNENMKTAKPEPFYMLLFLKVMVLYKGKFRKEKLLCQENGCLNRFTLSVLITNIYNHHDILDMMFLHFWK